MARLQWDKIGERFFEAGVEKGVLYVQNANGTYNKGVAWNGLTGVNVSPSGAEPTKLWANNAQYGTVLSQEELGATIEAYTYPDEFAVCDGSAELAPGVHVGQQTRMPFALAYVTKIGNDVQSLDHGYKIHIIYGALAAPSEKNYQTINESPEAITFSWEVTTTPVDVPGFKPTAYVTIDSTAVDPEILKTIEDTLYGTDSTEPELLMPADIIDIINVSESSNPGEGY